MAKNNSSRTLVNLLGIPSLLVIIYLGDSFLNIPIFSAFVGVVLFLGAKEIYPLSKSKKGQPRNNAERMFNKSTIQPQISLDMFKQINIPLHKDLEKINEWTQKLNEVYDIDMKAFKSFSKEMFTELIDEFTIYSE